jgi:hypothetical protein
MRENPYRLFFPLSWLGAFALAFVWIPAVLIERHFLTIPGWNAAKNVAGNMANNYAQGENLQQVRRAMTQIQGLQQSLKNMNLRNQNVDNMLMQLTTTLQGYNQRLAQDNTMRTNQPGWHKQPPPIPQTV